MQYASYNNYSKVNKQEVGKLWGVNMLGLETLFYDDGVQKYYIVDYKDGMCGIEEKVTYFDELKENQVVKIGDYKYSVRFGENQFVVPLAWKPTGVMGNAL